MNEAPAPPAFPTAAALPFPFESPYEVQTELMAAVLGALRQCQERDEAARDAVVDGADAGARRGVLDEPATKRRAPIVMLESPTGTGKSLSLACASMAWLRHRAGADLDALLPPGGGGDRGATTSPDGRGEAKAVSPSPTSSSLQSHKPKIKKYDWIEAWQPAEPTSENDQPASSSPQQTPASHSSLPWEGNRIQTQSHRRERIRSFAIENRAALEKELNGIRARLDRMAHVASFAPPPEGGSSRRPSDPALPAQERTLRENLVRSGVASALARERKRNRQLARGGKGRKGGRGGGNKRRKTDAGPGRGGDDEFLLDAYHSEDEARGGDVSSSDGEDDDRMTLSDLGLSKGARALSSKALLEGSNLDGSGYENDPERNARRNDSRDKGAGAGPTVGAVAAGTGLRKIVYAARTHSQLSQFIGELRRTHWGKDARVVALGSRSLLCGNESVLYRAKNNKNSRRSQAEITELCLDLQKGKRDRAAAGQDKENRRRAAATAGGCPYLASSEAVSALAMHSLVRPSDIEDVSNLGRASRACAYYASREALAAAEVVVLPYNTLLSPQARRSVGLSLKNALVIVDEAHNIPEALRGLSSCQLSLPVAEAALSQLLSYTRKYAGRLAGRNVFYLGQIRRILLAMIKYLKRPPAGGRNASAEPDADPFKRKQMMAAVDLMFAIKLDNINLFAILRYLEKSRLSQKLLGFINHTTAAAEGGQEEASKMEPREENAEFVSKHVSSMSIVETFLERLCGTSREGKVIVEWPSEEASAGSNPTFRFVQIHSASQLDNVVTEAHAIVLAGGTLRPFTHVAAELFGDDMDVMRAASNAEEQLAREYDALPAGLSGSASGSRPAPSSLVQITPRLTTFTCGHVIPPSNVVTACLSSGPTSKKLDFRHASRSCDDMIDELGRTILNLCNVIPKGFVVFLPSYNYESRVFQRWRSTGFLNQINKKKSVHREPKNSRDLESALARYSAEATNSKSGALLVSVMGGKMSEGINFANDMARCVLVAGLPYADVTDPVLKEKMQSLDREYRAAGVGITGQAYYQNLCMRTVNQSVGRAIRHADDYAAIVLADFRYATDARIWRGLPQWLRRGRGAPRQEDATFGKVMKQVRSFFSEK